MEKKKVKKVETGPRRYRNEKYLSRARHRAACTCMHVRLRVHTNGAVGDDKQPGGVGASFNPDIPSFRRSRARTKAVVSNFDPRPENLPLRVLL